MFVAFNLATLSECTTNSRIAYSSSGDFSQILDPRSMNYASDLVMCVAVPSQRAIENCVAVLAERSAVRRSAGPYRPRHAG